MVDMNFDMNMDIVTRCRDWLTHYCWSFAADAGNEALSNYRLKETHSYAVCDTALLIAKELALDVRERLLAGVVGVLHDVGRFPQYRDFRTFRDSLSKNHAVLGAKVLLEDGVLRDLPAEDRNVIIRAVTLHNVFRLPEGLDSRTLLHSRIIRDADKFDIWRIFIGLLALPASDRPTAAGLDLLETKDYSAEVLPALKERRLVRLGQLRTLNDFKLLQLAWIYDLNFLPSLHLVRDQRIIDRLSATLPATPGIERAVDSVRRYVDEQIDRSRMP